MPDFLLELRSEEIPARMQVKAAKDLAFLLSEELMRAGLAFGEPRFYAGPRRLAVIIPDLPLQTDPTTEERKGPRADAPAQAIEGFLKSTGLGRDQLVERSDKKGNILFALIQKPGRDTSAVLAEAIPAIVRAFPWPKSMRWGAASVSTEALRWVRPLQGIVALLGEEIVDSEIGDVRTGAATLGHRFHHPGIITIGSANDYVEKLRACHVVVDHDERRRLIAEGAARLADEAGLALVEDEGLTAENAGLTEWPVPLLGRFDEAFLEVPPEIIRLTMRTNQKYFALTGDGLAPAFICTANIEAADGGAAIVAGNERVLSARLSDAKFFWKQDLATPLETQAQKLGNIVFHEKLGTLADKVERIAGLARWLIAEGAVRTQDETQRTEYADLADRAARLCKADLVTGTVGEFPELQGIIGAAISIAQGEHPLVADAIRDHYKPAGQGDAVPTLPVSVAVSLADKLDTIMSFFSIQERPSGSKDPFALRRAALGVLSLQIANGLRFGLRSATEAWAHGASGEWASAGAFDQLLDFFADRLKVQQREAGVRHDLIDAVFALGGEDDFVRLLARVKALQAFVVTAEGADLLAGYKRAANILKKEEWAGTDVRKQPHHALAAEEAALTAALDAAEPRVRAAVAAEDFEGAMVALASLRAPVDAFFDKVIVNDPDPAKREARLALLDRIRGAVHRIADFSKIEG